LLTEEQDAQRRLKGHDDDLQIYIEGSTWMHKTNSLYTGFALKNDFLVGFVFSGMYMGPSDLILAV
jgi:hypothetical protein